MVGRPFRGDDGTLARRAAAGDEVALRVVLERVTPRLRAIAWHLTYDREMSRDLVQEALAKVVLPATLERYRGEGPLAGFLVRVGARAMISVARTGRVSSWREMESLESMPEAMRGGSAAVDGSRSLDPGLRSAMMALSEQARMIVLLMCVADYSYEEVADQLGLPVGTVKSSYSRARATVRRTLAGQRIDLAKTE